MGHSSHSVRSSNNEQMSKDEEFVHEEIKHLAQKVRSSLQEQTSRYTTAEGVLNELQRNSISRRSRLLLEREWVAAREAQQSGLYCLWKNRNKGDFCCRVGSLHRCFCGHLMSSHRAPQCHRGVPVTGSCNECSCKHFEYIPNEPEEVGEPWLARRANFVQGVWRPKCRCGHSNEMHDCNVKKCRKCSCFQFNGMFACVVCDRPFDDHETCVETEAERLQRGMDVAARFTPLQGLPSQVTFTETRCHNCNVPFSSESSKFCPQCGVKRE
jgi:hypothetical protein